MKTKRSRSSGKAKTETRMATIKDVARRASVSIATVSYVLNGTRNVRPETRRKVLAAAQALAYAPNSAARSLVVGQSSLLGLVVSDIRNPFFPELTVGFQDAANFAGLDEVMINTNYDAQRTRNALSRLLALQVAGVAVLTSQIDREVMAMLSDRRVCAVFLDLGKVGPGVSRIAVDYEQGIGAAVEYVLQLGHQRIGFIGGAPNLASAQRRRKAFLAGMEKAGIAEYRVIDSNFTVEGGYVACSRLLAAFPATAIIAANDLMAIGAMHCAQDRKIRVPEDLSIIGFDDISFARFTQPALTSVALPRVEIGRVAFEALFAMMNDPNRAGVERRIATALAVRDSTAPAPNARIQTHARKQNLRVRSRAISK
jgi:LacI family transcriptional regulator